jgi:hypothetical protein
MTDTDIHSCGYYCDKPACIKAQRDELRNKLFSDQAVKTYEPQETIAKWIKANTEHRQWYICPKCSYQAPRFRDEWVGLTLHEIDYIEGMTLDKHDAIRMAAVALKEKNNG